MPPNNVMPYGSVMFIESVPCSTIPDIPEILRYQVSEEGIPDRVISTYPGFFTTYFPITSGITLFGGIYLPLSSGYWLDRHINSILVSKWQYCCGDS